MEMRREQGVALRSAANYLTRSAALANQEPPHDIDAETAVLGAIMLDQRVLAQVSAIVTEEDFYHPAHGLIFEVFKTLDANGKPIDPVTVCDELRRRERLNTVGGAQYLGELTDVIPTIVHAPAHAGIVADLARTRRVRDAGQEIYLRASERGNVESYVEWATQRLEKATRARGSKGMVDPVDLAVAVSNELSLAVENRALCVASPATGLVDVDKILPLRGNRFVILAARPAMGKTSLAMKIAASTARATGQSVMFFTLEMTGAELVRRFVSMEYGLNVEAMEKGMLSGDDLARFHAGLEVWAKAGIWVNPDDQMEWSVESIVAEVMTFADSAKKAGKPLALIVIDYLQLIKLGDAETKDAAIGIITRKLKLLSKALKVPIIALSQLNRKCEERGDKRPMLSDLRDSGSIEQDADVVAFVYRDEVYNKNTSDKGIAEIIIAKQRGGRCGTAKVLFVGERTLFTDLAAGEPPPGAYPADDVPRDEFGDPLEPF